MKNVVLYAALLWSVAGCSVKDVKEESESDRANALFDAMYEEHVQMWPEWQTSEGRKTNKDKWNDLSEEQSRRALLLNKSQLAILNNMDTSQFDEQTRLSYQLLVDGKQKGIADYQWRYHGYPVNQLFGIHSHIPSFLANRHRIEDLQDAEDYITRVQAVESYLGQAVESIKVRAQKGIIPPKFVFPHVIESCRSIISGFPFDDEEPNMIWADFAGKLEKLKFPESEKQQLQDALKQALVHHYMPAYEHLIRYMGELETAADTKDGVWKFPAGKAFYDNLLQRYTSTDLTADDIHEIGLREVERIHKRIKSLKDQVGFEGELAEFFQFLLTDERFFYPNTVEGRKAYLAKTQTIIDEIQELGSKLFLSMPETELLVKRVESYREKSSPIAFYQRPARDGSRPGIYYVNLYQMADMSKNRMRALAYHEAFPGHHMQISIAQQLDGLPLFRKHGGNGAYVEGWGLYAEYIPTELGVYSNPYEDIGRLAMELWRAIRLVVDTGIHAKGWTREKAIQYITAQSPTTVSDATRSVERYIVMPAQATTYKIGMIKILELKQFAEDELGEHFDIREFHDVILRNGPLPLDVLEKEVWDWVKSKRKG